MLLSRYSVYAMLTSMVVHGIVLLLPLPTEDSWGQRKSTLMSVSLGGGSDSSQRQPIQVAKHGTLKDKNKTQQKSPGKNDNDGENAEESPGTDELRAYGRRIARAIRRVERRMRKSVGMDGTKVVLRIRINRNGDLLAPPVIVKSSGVQSLDKRAVAMVQYAAPFGSIPVSFLKSSAVILIPMRVAN